jgi:hypothetical protein
VADALGHIRAALARVKSADNYATLGGLLVLQMARAAGAERAALTEAARAAFAEARRLDPALAHEWAADLARLH